MTGLTWTEARPGTGEVVSPDGRVLARYEWQRANHPYFDEIRPLAHAGVLSTHAPHDHRWHHGLWWSWKFIEDVLFWEDHPGYGGNRIGLGRSVVTHHHVEQSDDSVIIRQALVWRVDDDGRELLTEDRRIVASIDPEDEGVWALDWDQTWTAPAAVRLETTPWPETSWGGYAGLNYRPARSMIEGELVSGDGVTGAAALHGSRSAWSSYTGQVDGAETDDPDHPAQGGVALLQHPANPEYPYPVYASSATAGFGFLATAPAMHGPIRLAAADSLRIRTRVAVLGTAADAGAVADAHRRYARMEDSRPT